MSKSGFLVSSARDVCTQESEGGDASEARIFQGLQTFTSKAISFAQLLKTASLYETMLSQNIKTFILNIVCNSYLVCRWVIVPPNKNKQIYQNVPLVEEGFHVATVWFKGNFYWNHDFCFQIDGFLHSFTPANAIVGYIMANLRYPAHCTQFNSYSCLVPSGKLT